jgi:hypothetical protein
MVRSGIRRLPVGVLMGFTAGVVAMKVATVRADTPLEKEGVLLGWFVLPWESALAGGAIGWVIGSLWPGATVYVAQSIQSAPTSRMRSQGPDAALDWSANRPRPVGRLRASVHRSRPRGEFTVTRSVGGPIGWRIRLHARVVVTPEIRLAAGVRPHTLARVSLGVRLGGQR